VLLALPAGITGGRELDPVAAVRWLARRRRADPPPSTVDDPRPVAADPVDSTQS
jgi:hypothetical protein